MPPPRSDSGRSGGDPAPVLARELEAPRGTPLYVHVPYCVVKCTYCDFFSVAADESSDLDGVVDGLLEEARRRAPRDPDTVFLGGGTPTFLGEEQLARLLVGLEETTGFRSSAREVSVECNPESLTLAKAQRMRALGVDRLSIGVQSLEPRVLELFARPHAAEDAFQAYRNAREAGFERVSLDVIYAVPGQELERWLADLARLVALAPDHLSAYSLAFEEGTTLTKALRAGKLERLPEETDLAFFLETRAHLNAAGYTPYEVSNFSTKGHRCAHNENYWHNGPYVGVGPGAVSKLERTRFGNPRSIASWRRGLARDGFAATWEETLPPRADLGQTWWLGLRTADGVRPDAARATAGFAAASDEDDPAVGLARELEAQGFLCRSAGAWSLSERGLPLADAVSRRFLDLTSGDGGEHRSPVLHG